MGAYWTLSNNPAVPVDYLSLSNLQACSGTPDASGLFTWAAKLCLQHKGPCEVWESVVCPALMSMKSLSPSALLLCENWTDCKMRDRKLATILSVFSTFEGRGFSLLSSLSHSFSVSLLISFDTQSCVQKPSSQSRFSALSCFWPNCSYPTKEPCVHRE